MLLFYRDTRFLIDNISSRAIVKKITEAQRELLVFEAKTNSRIIVDFLDDELTQIEDELGDLLASQGIHNGEINALGKYIESLIDLVLKEIEIRKT